MSDAVVPRNFKLLAELEAGEKGESAVHGVSYGIKNPENPDLFFHDWNATILSNQGDIFSLEVFCDDNYPDTPPQIKFVGDSRPSSDAVDSKGRVKLSKLMSWNRSGSIEKALIAISQRVVRR